MDDRQILIAIAIVVVILILLYAMNGSSKKTSPSDDDPKNEYGYDKYVLGYIKVPGDNNYYYKSTKENTLKIGKPQCCDPADTNCNLIEYNGSCFDASTEKSYDIVSGTRVCPPYNDYYTDDKRNPTYFQRPKREWKINVPGQKAGCGYYRAFPIGSNNGEVSYSLDGDYTGFYGINTMCPVNYVYDNITDKCKISKRQCRNSEGTKALITDPRDSKKSICLDISDEKAKDPYDPGSTCPDNYTKVTPNTCILDSTLVTYDYLRELDPTLPEVTI